MNKKPIGGVIVSVLDENKDAIAYDISSDEGEFNLSFTNSENKILLVGRMLGYKEEQLEIENREIATTKSVLGKTGIEIKEVLIKSKPININEDTLKYSVNTF